MSQSVKQLSCGSTKGSSQLSNLRAPILHKGTFISQQESFIKTQRGGHRRAPSVHGGSGGKGISISSHGYSTRHGCQTAWKNDGLLSFNEKETMQILNNRLASYLEKVSSLEHDNAQLERNIRERHEKNQPDTLPDCSNYFKTINDLQSQIITAYVENARVFLQFDNAKLATDDFRIKYEIELSMSNSILSDVNGLHRILEKLNIEKCDVDIQVQSLQEELQQLKRNHEEEVNHLRGQLGLKVSVEVAAAPCSDLNKCLSEIRKQYENLMDKNMQEVESIFLARSEELNREVVSGSEQLQSLTSDLIELKRTLQTLEIELQSQWSLKEALDDDLAETSARYSSQLSQLQDMINHVECQLAQVRSDLERQNVEYKILMDQKTHLEMEIATYKRLLEGHDTQVQPYSKGSTNQATCPPINTLGVQNTCSITGRRRIK